MMKKRWLFLFFLLMAALLARPVCSETVLSVSAAETRGFQENEITVFTPAAGLLTLTVSDSGGVWRRIATERPVEAGETVVIWDGLGENEERIPDGDYTLSASLQTSSGTVLSATCPLRVLRCRQALLYALPSSDTLYLSGNEEWFVELNMIRPGTLVMDICSASEPDRPLYTRTKKLTGYGLSTYDWDGTVGKDTIAEGEYVLRFYAEENPAYARKARVKVTADDPPVIPLAVTGSVLPERGDSDEAIWALMMQPSCVVDLKPVSHQKIFDRPSTDGKSLGTVHGQSQALEVLEIRPDGWVRVSAWNHESGEKVTGYVPASRLKMVQPQGEYGVLLDKKTQELTVFRAGERLGTVKVSTGLVAKGKLIRETAAGAFLSQEHMKDFSTNGLNYDYVIRYDGGNLLHQIAYRRKGGAPDFSEQTAKLGAKASHGCVRIQREAGENGLNAYWLWTHLPYHTRVMVLDDPEERAREAAAVSGGKDPQAVVALTSPADPPELAEGETELTLTLGGDVVLGTREKWWDEADALPACLAREGMAYPFSRLFDLFTEDDMTLVNLECVLKETAAGEDRDKLYRFRGLPSYTEALRLASIEQVNIANNHHIDYKQAGRKSTCEALDAAGIAYSGYGAIWIWEQDGHKIGFGGCRETTYRKDKSIIREEVTALKQAGCDVVVYSIHAGKEYSAGHNAIQEEMAREAALAGAALVVGTHPHVVQGVDTVEGAAVLYSLGNLMFGGTHEMTTFDGTLARVHLRFAGQTYTGMTLELIPILTSSSGDLRINNFCPTVAEGDDRARIWGKMQADSGLRLTAAMYFPAALSDQTE